MATTIVVAGATGRLGGLIVGSLLETGPPKRAHSFAPARTATSSQSLSSLT